MRETIDGWLCVRCMCVCVCLLLPTSVLVVGAFFFCDVGALRVLCCCGRGGVVRGAFVALALFCVLDGRARVFSWERGARACLGGFIFIPSSFLGAFFAFDYYCDWGRHFHASPTFVVLWSTQPLSVLSATEDNTVGPLLARILNPELPVTETLVSLVLNHLGAAVTAVRYDTSE